MAGTLTVQNIQGPTSGDNANKIIVPSGHELYAAGHVVQVLQANKTDTSSHTGTTWTDVSGLSLSITPTNASSKILVISDISLGHSINHYAYYRLLRDGSLINGGDASSGRPNITGMLYDNANEGMIGRQQSTYLDSPATASSITYKIQISGSGSVTTYVNRSRTDTAGTFYSPRTASSLILMEIAQ